MASDAMDLGGLTYVEYENTLGKAIFGKPNRMVLGLWMCRLDAEHAERFWASQFSDWLMQTKRGYAQVGVDLERFERMHMIEVTDVDRAKFYRRLTHPLWDVFRLLDSILSEFEDPGTRRAFTTAPDTFDRMVGDLRRIYERTGPVPTVEPTVVSVGEERGWPGNYRKRNGKGDLQCTRCKKWKAPGRFSRRPNRPGLYKSHCKTCMAEQARVRYLGLQKVEALNAVGLTFVVVESDDIVGLACTDCGKPIEPGQEVAGHTRLWHTACLTI
jgi:hypothetical protein